MTDPQMRPAGEMTALAPRLVLLPILFGSFLLLIVLAFLLLSSRKDGAIGHARVLSTTEDTASIAVLDGPDPGTWTVDFLDAGEADPGDVVTVRLRGECGCEPYPDPGSLAFLGVGAALFGLLFVLSLRNSRKLSGIRSRQLRSAAAADRGEPFTPVTVRATFTDGTARTTQLWLEVIEVGTGRSLGWLDIRRARPGFDAPALTWLVGHPTLGSDVALLSADGTRRALAASPLSSAPAGSAAWSSLVVDTLGWTPLAGSGVPTIGGDGRLSVASPPPPDGGAPGPSSGAAAALAEAVRTQRVPKAKPVLVAVYGLGLAALLFVPFPASLAAIAAGVGVLAFWTNRRMAPVRAAVQRAAPQLARKDAATVSALLVALRRPDAAPSA